MTIREAIGHLTRLGTKHGPTVQVYFDCPHCGTAFAPETVVTEAVHLTGTPDKKEKP